MLEIVKNITPQRLPEAVKHVICIFRQWIVVLKELQSCSHVFKLDGACFDIQPDMSLLQEGSLVSRCSSSGELVLPLTAADLLRKSITLLASSGSRSLVLDAREQLLQSDCNTMHQSTILLTEATATSVYGEAHTLDMG